MDTLDVSDAQKATLRNVADHLLQIYKTLARMRYLDPDWINVGPHDIAANIADYRSHGLEDSIIYLYSVLPYINSDFAGQVDFYEGGEFIDFRNPARLRRSRRPLYSNEPGETMKPWMTPLSMGGNDGVAIIYSAKKSRIWMRTAAHIGSLDPAIMSGDYDYGGDNESSSDDDDDDDDGDDDEGNPYSEENGRPATAVLADINRCFLELKTLPGGGEYSSLMWERTVTKPLYEKHAWPSQDFDGDAFLIDLIRADVQSTVQTASNPSIDLERLQYSAKRFEDPAFWKYWEDCIVAETDPERQWMARRHLWGKRRHQKNVAMQLSRALSRGVANTHRAVSELQELRKQLEQRQSRLAKLDAEDSATGEGAQLLPRQARRDVDLYNRAYEQAKIEAPPGVVEQSLSESQADNAAADEEARQLQRELCEDTIQDAKAFLETIPCDIKLAREEMEYEIFRNTF